MARCTRGLEAAHERSYRQATWQGAPHRRGPRNIRSLAKLPELLGNGPAMRLSEKQHSSKVFVERLAATKRDPGQFPLPGCCFSCRFLSDPGASGTDRPRERRKLSHDVKSVSF